MNNKLTKILKDIQDSRIDCIRLQFLLLQSNYTKKDLFNYDRTLEDGMLISVDLETSEFQYLMKYFHYEDVFGNREKEAILNYKPGNMRLTGFYMDKKDNNIQFYPIFNIINGFSFVHMGKPYIIG